MKFPSATKLKIKWYEDKKADDKKADDKKADDKEKDRKLYRDRSQYRPRDW